MPRAVADRFRIPPLWRGKSALVIAAGPGLTAEDVVAARGLVDKTVVVNTSIRMAPDADLLWFTDLDWFQTHRDEALAFKGQIATLENENLRKVIPGLWCIKNLGRKGFHPHPDGIMHGLSGGYCALHLLAHMGVRRMVLLGFACADGPEGPHWHGRHGNGLKNPEASLYQTWRNLLGGLAPELAKRGIEVVNASRITALDCFPRMTLEDALAESLHRVPRTPDSEDIAVL